MTHQHTSRDGEVAVEPQGGAALEDEVGLFSVLAVASRLHRRVEEVLESVGLSYPGYEVLAHLREISGRATLGELDEVVRTPGMSVGLVIDELSRAGSIRVMRKEVSGEPAEVTLTPLGSARALEGRMQLDIVLLEFAAHFQAEERVDLRRLLEKVGA